MSPLTGFVGSGVGGCLFGLCCPIRVICSRDVCLFRGAGGGQQWVGSAGSDGADGGVAGHRLPRQSHVNTSHTLGHALTSQK